MGQWGGGVGDGGGVGSRRRCEDVVCIRQLRRRKRGIRWGEEKRHQKTNPGVIPLLKVNPSKHLIFLTHFPVWTWVTRDFKRNLLQISPTHEKVGMQHCKLLFNRQGVLTISIALPQKMPMANGGLAEKTSSRTAGQGWKEMALSSQSKYRHMRCKLFAYHILEVLGGLFSKYCYFCSFFTPLESYRTF